MPTMHTTRRASLPRRIISFLLWIAVIIHFTSCAVPVNKYGAYQVGDRFKTISPVKLHGEQDSTIFPSATRYSLERPPYRDDAGYYQRSRDLDIGTLLKVKRIWLWRYHPEIGRHAMVDAVIDSGPFIGTQLHLDMVLNQPMGEDVQRILKRLSSL